MSKARKLSTDDDQTIGPNTDTPAAAPVPEPPAPAVEPVAEVPAPAVEPVPEPPAPVPPAPVTPAPAAKPVPPVQNNTAANNTMTLKERNKKFRIY